MATDALTGSLTNIVNFITAAGGLGTAAMGLVDSLKVFGGGPSKFGFGYIEAGLRPFLVRAADAPAAFGEAAVLRTLNANWINGVAIDDQKAKAKSLIHLGLTQGNAVALAAASGVDAATLAQMATNVRNGTALTPAQVNVLGEFDAILSAVLDAAYERGDQKYRNSCKAIAMVISTVLGVVGGWIVFGDGSLDYFATSDFPLCVVVGLIGTPLAPVAKDLATALQSAVAAVGMVRR